MVAEIVARLIGGAVLATGGWRLGEYISDVWGPEQYVPRDDRERNLRSAPRLDPVRLARQANRRLA